jgi:CheY-like chemotaxis protein
MKSLLLYNNNLNQEFVKLFEERHVIYPPKAEMVSEDFNMDLFIHNRLREVFSKGKFDCIYIPYTLNTENHIEYSGLLVALHIRLTPEFNHQYSPIVFVGYEEALQVAKITEFGSLLFTSGIYYVSVQSETQKQAIEKLIQNKPLLNTDDFSNFLSKIEVKPPANYNSHHSIANEWSILRWAKVLDSSVDGGEIKSIKNTIEGSLYYKFLYLKYPIKNDPDKGKYVINGTGRILLIDDEWEKGWKVLLKDFFSFSPGLKNNLSVLEIDFKSLDRDEIVDLSEKRILKEQPYIVILDLRLCDADFKLTTRSNDFSGVQILQKIKALNPGIQVILFTASNKVWNLLEFQKLGANGFLLKESPELSINKEYAKENIVGLKRQIEFCLEQKYLIDLWNDITKIDKYLSPKTKGASRSLPTEFYNAIKNYLRNLFEVLNTTSVLTKYDSAFLFSFLILEASAKEFIDEENPIGNNDGHANGNYSFIFRRTGQKLFYFEERNQRKANTELRSINRRINYNQKFLNLIYYFTGDVARTFRMVNKRNKYFHPDLIEYRTTETIDKDDVLNVFEIVKKLLLSI